MTGYTQPTPSDIFGQPRKAKAKRPRQNAVPTKAPQRVSTVDKNGKRTNRTIKPKPQPGAYKRSKSTPGSRQVTPKQKGKGAK